MSWVPRLSDRRRCEKFRRQISILSRGSSGPAPSGGTRTGSDNKVLVGWHQIRAEGSHASEIVETRADGNLANCVDPDVKKVKGGSEHTEEVTLQDKHCGCF